MGEATRATDSQENDSSRHKSHAVGGSDGHGVSRPSGRRCRRSARTSPASSRSRPAIDSCEQEPHSGAPATPSVVNVEAGATPFRTWAHSRASRAPECLLTRDWAALAAASARSRRAALCSPAARLSDSLGDAAPGNCASSAVRLASVGRAAGGKSGLKWARPDQKPAVAVAAQGAKALLELPRERTALVRRQLLELPAQRADGSASPTRRRWPRPRPVPWLLGGVAS